MTILKTVWRSSAAAALLLAGMHPAAADEMEGLYFGVGAGRVNYEVTLSDDIDSVTLDDHTSGWKGFVGWQFNKWLGVEVTYFDGSSVELSPDTSILSVRLGTDALMAHATGTYWLNEYFGLHGRAGVASWDSEFSLSDGFTAERVSDDGEDFAWGAGLSWIYDRALIRFEYEQVDADDTTIEFLSGSIAWRF